MKNFVILAMLMIGLIFSSCKKENKVAEEMPQITNFKEFQAWAGDRLVLSPNKSNDDFITYVYNYEDESIAPLYIAQLKDEVKDIKPPIICDKEIFCWGSGFISCNDVGDECSYMGEAGTYYCDIQKLMGCLTQ